jgi:hypothetical protein
MLPIWVVALPVGMIALLYLARLVRRGSPPSLRSMIPERLWRRAWRKESAAQRGFRELVRREETLKSAGDPPRTRSSTPRLHQPD